MLSVGQTSFGHVAPRASGLLAPVEQHVVCTGGIGLIQSNEPTASCNLNAPIGPKGDCDKGILAHAPLMTERATFAEKKLSLVYNMDGSYQDLSLDSERRSTLTIGYVAIETGWADATGNGPQPRKEPFLQEQTGGPGPGLIVTVH